MERWENGQVAIEVQESADIGHERWRAQPAVIQWKETIVDNKSEKIQSAPKVSIFRLDIKAGTRDFSDTSESNYPAVITDYRARAHTHRTRSISFCPYFKANNIVERT